MNLNKERTGRLAFAGLFAALVFVTTWMIHLPIGTMGGYVHFGDALVYTAASILPLPYAMAASAIGAGLSDLLSPGGAVWILPTILIKPLCCLAFTRRGGRILCRRNVIAVFVAGLITMTGYSLATLVMTGSVAAALAEYAMGMIQPVGSGVCYLVWSFALDRARIKQALPGYIGGNRP